MLYAVVGVLGALIPASFFALGVWVIHFLGIGGWS